MTEDTGRSPDGSGSTRDVVAPEAAGASSPSVTIPIADEAPEQWCSFTQNYCTGDFCEDYGCAKEAGIWDDEDDL